MKKVPFAAAVLAACACMAGNTADAADVIVQVRGARSDAGNVGCSLFASEKGFPMDNSGTRQHWVAISQGTATCRFAGVEPGTYAIAVAHDLNGNRRVDSNFLGIPTEGWAVSRNVVPMLRAPRFDEASFRVEGEAPIVLPLALAY